MGPLMRADLLRWSDEGLGLKGLIGLTKSTSGWGMPTMMKHDWGVMEPSLADVGVLLFSVLSLRSIDDDCELSLFSASSNGEDVCLVTITGRSWNSGFLRIKSFCSASKASQFLASVMYHFFRLSSVELVLTLFVVPVLNLSPNKEPFLVGFTRSEVPFSIAAFFGCSRKRFWTNSSYLRVKLWFLTPAITSFRLCWVILWRANLVRNLSE